MDIFQTVMEITMVTPTMITNIVFCVILILIICMYGLDMKEPYPQMFIKLFSEPIVRFILYISIFLLAQYVSVTAAILVLLMVVLLHIDYTNLILQE